MPKPPYRLTFRQKRFCLAYLRRARFAGLAPRRGGRDTWRGRPTNDDKG